MDPLLRVHRVPLELMVDFGVRSAFVRKLKTVLNIFSNGDSLLFTCYTRVPRLQSLTLLALINFLFWFSDCRLSLHPWPV